MHGGIVIGEKRYKDPKKREKLKEQKPKTRDAQRREVRKKFFTLASARIKF